MPANPRLVSIAHLYPFESHFLDVGGVRMHYVDEGDGPPIVLVHGNPTWSFYFRELVKGLRDRYRVIALDHIGCGLSDKPQRYPYTLATHIDNLGRLIEHLGLESFTLGGHDWGGAIGFGWAVRNPERIRRLIVFNTAAFLGGPMPFRIRVCRWPILGDLLVRGLNGFSRAAIHMACKDRSRMTPQVARGYLLPYDSWANRVGVMRFVRDIPVSPRVPSHAVLRKIEVGLPKLADKPMIVFWGGKDFCFNDTFLKEWRNRFPLAEVHRFADAGHYVVEDAHERIVPLLRRFAETAVDSGPAALEAE
ncbi:MAG: alpha/beta fold hydrolase [Phycisphaerales bacterium]|nr:alpha/beta fold hydrolase [Phycisphaerales bacterium]